MNLEPREELISAYLDDELAPQERAEVERMMAEQPALRQLHDELAALRATMQALPRHKLEHDLGPAVLRRAERTVLGGASTSDAVAGHRRGCGALDRAV
jgi:anti-sigma factor RsiW